VATPVLVLAQVPPVGNADNEDVPPIHKISGPVNATVGLIDTIAVMGSERQFGTLAV
jgi:hypothetical protein